MKRSFKFITLFGIKIEINVSWFIILALVVFTLARGYFPQTNPELPAPAYWLMALAAAFLLFASLLAHELSHSLVAIRNKLPIHSITLFIFGGVAHLEEEPSSPIIELKMAIAGPLMSFTLAFIFYILTQLVYYLNFSTVLLSITNYLFVINLFVGIFNLIPGFPLDGGRILRSLIWFYSKNLKKATGIASAFGKGFAYFLIAAGLLELFMGSVISGIWFIFIGLFLQEAADISYRQLMLKKSLVGIRVENIMTKNVITVPASLTLDKLFDEYFFRFRFASFPVIEDDNLLGMVTFHSVKEVGREKWHTVPVREVMLPLSPKITIQKDLEISSALQKMASNNYGRLLVIEDSKLIGIISQRDIMRLFEFKAELEEE